jgi:hypothetical protein
MSIKNRLENLEAAFVQEPDESAVEETRQRIARGQELRIQDVRAIAAAGSVTIETPDWWGTASIGRDGDVAITRLYPQDRLL